MTLKSKLISVAIGSMLLFGGAAYWLQAYVSHQVADAKLHQEIDTKDKIIASASQALADRQKEWNTAQIAWQSKIDSITTVAAARVQLQPIVIQGASGQPIATQQVTKAELPANVQSQIAGAPDTKLTVVTDPQLVDLGKFTVKCNENAAALNKCSLDVADLGAKFDAADSENKLLKAAKSPYIPPRNNLLLAATSDRGALVAVSHRFKVFGDRFSVFAGIESNGINRSRMLGGIAFPLGK